MIHPYLENRFYDLLGKKMAAEADPAELKEIQDLLVSYPELQFLYDQMMKPLLTEKVPDTEAAYLAHSVKLQYAMKEEKYQALPNAPTPENKNMNSIGVMLKIGIAASLLLGVFFAWQYNSNNKDKNHLVVSKAATDKGSKSVLSLPDGSTVHLNTNSKITYNPEFGKNSREVTLTGEAFFDVAHNAQVPFIVHTSAADIKVLGTQFNVRDYADEKNLEASLLKGAIEVSLVNGDKNKIRLRPNDKIVISHKNTGGATTLANKITPYQLTTIHTADSIVAETSWLLNKLAFVNKPFFEVVKDLERQFNITIQIHNSKYSNYHYTGVFDDANVEDVLQVLQMIKPFKYRINKNEVIIY